MLQNNLHVFKACLTVPLALSNYIVSWGDHKKAFYFIKGDLNTTLLKETYL